jgi:hypothetical protein
MGKMGTKEGLFPEAFVQPAAAGSSSEMRPVPIDVNPSDATFGMSSDFAAAPNISAKRYNKI